MVVVARSESEGFRHLFTEAGGFKEVVRTPFRPLGLLSDFVVEELPESLEMIKNGLGNVELLSTFVDASLPENTALRFLGEGKERDVALLDMKMLMFGIIHSGGQPGPRLSELVKTYSALCGQPVSMTYEEIILINPENDPRLFTRGEVGEAEYDFYHVHRLVEPVLESAIVIADTAKEAMLSQDFLTASALVRESAEHIQLAADHIQVVGQGMNPDLFYKFRQYLGSYTEAGLPGPSGAFTARIPLLDMMLAGEQFPPGYYEAIQPEEKLRFFPRDGRPKMRKEMEKIAGKQNKSLVGMYHLAEKPVGMGDQLEMFRQALLSFRKHHFRGVVRHVPDAVNDSIEGTGGQGTPGTFLRERMRYLREIMIDRQDIRH